MFAAGLYPGVDYEIEGRAAVAPDGGEDAQQGERLSLTVRLGLG